MKTKNASTEEKIKEAARVVFTKKGYAATKTRDIAEEAGLNLALLNYYFRSKEKLFEIVMIENLQRLFSFLAPTLNNKKLTLEEKIEAIATNYIDMLFQNPDLPLFVLSEIRTHPERFAAIIQLDTLVLKSHFMQQIQQRKKKIHPLQFLISFMGMLIFPFISRPVFQTSNAFKEEAFIQLIEERKKLVPEWMNCMLE
ncbi:TetR/AcrR family transcriptional regulator [Niabella beijingensis]|uniref:TetR/AcrR family transcriptional regulator n=1 Tax=Niabella beijingensis TaxID=2872700 RepID=UPI001CBB7BF8|nr:TetR family transcriptional regulator [Niabella beijingensis]MBZ4187824.1 TetR family transcriptional regulator [Niabella beijingensis]